MQRRDTNSHPLGICQRVFNFIMNNLIPPSLKSLTMSKEGPFEGSSRSSEQNLINSDGEIVVEFRHVNGLEQWTPDPKKGNPPVMMEKRNGSFKPSYKEELPVVQKIDVPVSDGGRGRVTRKPSRVKWTEEEKGKKQKKDVPIEKLAAAAAPPPVAEERKPPTRPLLNNINEKSEDFIHKKIAALRRTNSLEQPEAKQGN